MIFLTLDFSNFTGYILNISTQFYININSTPQVDSNNHFSLNLDHKYKAKFCIIDKTLSLTRTPYLRINKFKTKFKLPNQEISSPWKKKIIEVRSEIPFYYNKVSTMVIKTNLNHNWLVIEFNVIMYSD